MAAILLDFLNRRNLRRERIFRDHTNVLDTLDDIDLISRYRFTRNVIFEIIDTVADQISLPTQRGGHVIPAPVQVLVTLRFLAKGDFLSEVGDIHGISKSSCSRIIYRVSTAINRSFQIRYPNTPEDVRKRKDAFFRVANFPNCTGMIDGTLIPIQAPSGAEEAVYVCRKGYHAINVQAICDPHMRFINVVVRWPGSTHDSFILSNSRIATIMAESNNGWLLGDGGYGLKPWLLTPFLNPTDGHEVRYNTAHCRTRNLIERAFGILKSRFRCLHSTGGHLPYKPERSVKIITSCFCLHNLAINHNMPQPDIRNVIVDHDDDLVVQQNGRGQEIRRIVSQRF